LHESGEELFFAEIVVSGISHVIEHKYAIETALGNMPTASAGKTSKYPRIFLIAVSSIPRCVSGYLPQ
jgi:hypothetical protein